MALDALLARLEGRAVTPVTPEAKPGVPSKPAPIKACTPVTPVTPENDDTAGKATGEPLPDPAAEARRQRVLAMLTERPGIRYAVLTDTTADPEAMLLTLAIRGRATCELRIPHAKYDPWLLLDLIETYEIRMLETGHRGLTR